MDLITAEWILEAVKIIESGKFDKLECYGVKVYRCGNVIRIDVKS
nr:MAG TPA: hypothetical protein [Caudoviricetes sp.]